MTMTTATYTQRNDKNKKKIEMTSNVKKSSTTPLLRPPPLLRAFAQTNFEAAAAAAHSCSVHSGDRRWANIPRAHTRSKYTGLFNRFLSHSLSGHSAVLSALAVHYSSQYYSIAFFLLSSRCWQRAATSSRSVRMTERKNNKFNDMSLSLSFIASPLSRFVWFVASDS